MKKSRALIMLLLTMVLSMNFGVYALAAYIGSGSGTEADPYLIETKEQLMSLSGQTITQNYKLTSDIDLENTAWTPITMTNGVFDGDGHVIKNLKVDTNASYSGFFNLSGSTSYFPTVKNLTIIGVDVKNAMNSGALAGSAVNANIINCHVISGEVSGIGNAGGLVGSVYNMSNVVDCSSSVNVSGESIYYLTTVGGLIGTIDLNAGLIERCYSTGNVTSNNNNAGGFVGYIENGKVSECYSTGIVTGPIAAGFCVLSSTTSDKVTNCFTLSKVNGSSNNTAFAQIYKSRTSGKIENCYSASVLEGTKDLNGIIPPSGTTPISSYFDSELFNVSALGARTTAQMMTQENFVGWDFDNIWGIDEGTSYPYLRNVPRPGGPVDPPIDPEYVLCVLLEVDEEVQLSVTNRLADNLNLIWTSVSDTVTSVDINGKVTALAAGISKIWAKTADGKFEECINVRVVEKSSSEMRLAMNLKVGQTGRLYLNDDFDNINWSSMDPTIVSVDNNGTVTALGKGLAIVKAEYESEQHLIYVRV